VKKLLPTLMLLGLLLTACGNGNAPANQTSRAIPGGDASGLVVGTTFEGKPLKVGEAPFKGKALVITYFATW
jgi:hypothetical protein